MERIWKEADVAPLKVLSQHLPGGAERSYKKPQSEQPASGPRFEPDTSRIQRRSANHAVISGLNP
jgi:hypothetical protein